MKSAGKPSQHFESVDEVVALFEEEVVASELRNYFRLDGIEYLWTKGGTLIPSITAPFSSPYLYRGQVARHQPCLPGVFRGLAQTNHPAKLPPADRARCFVDRVRLEEFILALDAHPASSYAREIGLRMHPYALAQHYELATDRIDLTQDHMVAAFFATNSRKDGVWVPEIEGVGVVYRLNHDSFQRHFQGRLECIGKQALPRPGEQKACTLTLPLGLDFESLPIETYAFSQDESCGQRLNDHFNGGSALFPSDVMAELATLIKSETSMPRQIVTSLLGGNEPALTLLADVLDRHLEFLEQHCAVRISERAPIGMTVAQQAAAMDAVENMRHTFLKGIGALAVRNARDKR